MGSENSCAALAWRNIGTRAGPLLTIAASSPAAEPKQPPNEVSLTLSGETDAELPLAGSDRHRHEPDFYGVEQAPRSGTYR